MCLLVTDPTVNPLRLVVVLVLAKAVILFVSWSTHNWLRHCGSPPPISEIFERANAILRREFIQTPKLAVYFERAGAVPRLAITD